MNSKLRETLRNFLDWKIFFMRMILAQFSNAQVGATSDDVLILHFYKYIHSNNSKNFLRLSQFFSYCENLVAPWWAWKLCNKTINCSLIYFLDDRRWSVWCLNLFASLLDVGQWLNQQPLEALIDANKKIDFIHRKRKTFCREKTQNVWSFMGGKK